MKIVHPYSIILYSLICENGIFFMPFLSTYEFLTLWKNLRMYRFVIYFSSSSPLQFRAWELSHTWFYTRFCWRLWCFRSLSVFLMVGFDLVSWKCLFSRDASTAWCGFRGMGAVTTEGAALASWTTSQKTTPNTSGDAPSLCVFTHCLCVNLWICVFAKLHSCVLVPSHQPVSCLADWITLQFATNPFIT